MNLARFMALLPKASSGTGSVESFEQIRDGFTPTAGQTEFTLSEDPNGGLVDLYVNGVLYVLDVDYTVSGTTLTWLEPFELEADDVVLAAYVIGAGEVVGSGSVYYPAGW